MVVFTVQGKETITIHVRDLSVFMMSGFGLFVVVGAATYFVLRYRGEHNGQE